ncbi:hypothetical protein M1146_07575 [Patescibacteria group bacterium]|nr:hypothetical protein [Patescibacteria group bacterium]
MFWKHNQKDFAQKRGNKKDSEGEEECEDAIGDNEDDNEETSITKVVPRISHGYNSDENGIFDTVYDSHGTYTKYIIEKNIAIYAQQHNLYLIR